VYGKYFSLFWSTLNSSLHPRSVCLRHPLIPGLRKFSVLFLSASESESILVVFTGNF
jgi:hypothetical protein